MLFRNRQKFKGGDTLVFLDTEKHGNQKDMRQQSNTCTENQIQAVMLFNVVVFLVCTDEGGSTATHQSFSIQKRFRF